MKASLIFLTGMWLGTWAFGATDLDPTGWSASFLEKVCHSTFLPGEEPGLLGPRVGAKLTPLRLYQRMDKFFGGVVWVTSDAQGNLDPRPLGPMSVLECTYGGITPSEGESGMCEIADGRFRPLPKGSPKANQRVIYRLSYAEEGSMGSSRFLEWEVSREFRLQKRDKRIMVPFDKTRLKDMGRAIIEPGKTVPKFYRTDAQYWRMVAGDNFAVPKGFWMQPFRDGNFHQVRLGFHLEEWPGENNVMFEVKDEESWIKVGSGDRAYYLIEKVRKGPDWAVVYAGGDLPPVNLKVTAAAACRACGGAQWQGTSAFEDLETIPLEPE